jgi:hypothetical protein
MASQSSYTITIPINIAAADKAKRLGSELRGEIEALVTKKLEEYS